MTAKKVKNRKHSIILAVLFAALVCYFVATLISLQSKVRAEEKAYEIMRATALCEKELFGKNFTSIRPDCKQFLEDCYVPEKLSDTLEYLLATKTANSTLAFVGDGVNDAPVIARADVGIAMGAMGSDMAVECADIVIMNDDIKKVADAVVIAKSTRRKAVTNIVISLAIKFVIMILSMFVVVTKLSQVILCV